MRAAVPSCMLSKFVCFVSTSLCEGRLLRSQVIVLRNSVVFSLLLILAVRFFDFPVFLHRLPSKQYPFCSFSLAVECEMLVFSTNFWLTIFQFALYVMLYIKSHRQQLFLHI